MIPSITMKLVSEGGAEVKEVLDKYATPSLTEFLLISAAENVPEEDSRVIYKYLAKVKRGRPKK